MYNIKLCGARIKKLQRSKFAEMKGELAWQRKTVCDHREGLSDDFTSLEPYLPRLLLTSVLFSDILFKKESFLLKLFVWGAWFLISKCALTKIGGIVHF